MKRLGLRVVCAIAGLLLFFRFGPPALIFGATGPGPFGNQWVAEGGTATLLLDADLRFIGALLIGIGVVFFWVVVRVGTLGPVTYILACAVAVGAAARVYARFSYGDPGSSGTLPVIIEVILPVLLILLQYYVEKDLKKEEPP